MNRDIPVPGIDGPSFKMLPWGGQIATPTLLPGLSVTSGLNFGASGFRVQDYNFTMNLDVTKFLRSRNISF